MLISESSNWTITFYDDRLEIEIDNLPRGIGAGFKRLHEMLKKRGANLRMPHSHSMGNGLFELRPSGTEGIGRVFYCVMIGKRIVLLHAFVKKTRETPIKELRMAHARMKEVKAHG
jgi:phage-related protein